MRRKGGGGSGASSSLFVLVGVGVASSSSSVLVPLCMFRVVLCRRWPRVWRWVRWRGLAVERHWPLDGGGGALVGWVCPVVASGGRGWFSWALAGVCGSLCVSRVFFPVVGRSWSFVGRLWSFLDSLHRVSGWAWFTVTWG